MNQPDQPPTPQQSATPYAMKLAKASQDEIDTLMRWLQDLETSDHGLPKPPPFMRVVFGYETLVQNCCDPSKDYLEFKPGYAPEEVDQLRAELTAARAEVGRLKAIVREMDDTRANFAADLRAQLQAKERELHAYRIELTAIQEEVNTAEIITDTVLHGVTVMRERLAAKEQEFLRKCEEATRANTLYNAERQDKAAVYTLLHEAQDQRDAKEQELAEARKSADAWNQAWRKRTDEFYEADDKLKEARAQLTARDATVAGLTKELEEAKEWKDGAFKTIYEIADAAYGREWSAGKNQDEIIGQVKRLKAHYDETTSVERIRVESEANARDAQSQATIAGLREKLKEALNYCASDYPEQDPFTYVETAIHEAIALLQPLPSVVQGAESGCQKHSTGEHLTRPWSEGKCVYCGSAEKPGATAVDDTKREGGK